MTRVEIHDDHLRLVDTDHHADYHARWLRHFSDLDCHPATGERLVDSSDLPEDVHITSAVVDDGVLRIEWRHDRRVSRYPLAWLRTHAYALDRIAVSPPPADVSRLELDGSAGPFSVAARLVDRLAHDGAAIVRREHANPDDETETWIDALVAQGLHVVETHFGRIEDLRTDNTTNANTDQLGYTDSAIGLHTDQPFLDHPPHYQLLQGIRAADRGGETELADGEAAYRYLASIDSEAAELLRTTPVRFHRKQKQFEREVVSPIVSVDDSGRIRIRSSYFTVAPYQVSFANMTAWYRAHDRFSRLIRDPRYHYRFAIRPGDVLVYDNHRMLHARTAFAGPRWIRGVYFNRTGERAGDRARSIGLDDDRSG